jgi:hypothetical protein
MRQWVLDNLGLKLLALFLASVLWAVVVGEQKVEVSVALPLELPIPPGLVAVNTVPETLEVSLRGPRTLVKSVVPREVSLQRLAPALQEGENLIRIRPEFVRVPRGVEVVDVLPERLRVALERLVEREVDVAPRIEGAPPPGYAIRRVVPAPARVTLIGPASGFKQLRRLRTLPVSVQGHTEPFTARVQLEPPGGQFRLPEESAVEIRIDIGPSKS